MNLHVNCGEASPEAWYAAETEGLDVAGSERAIGILRTVDRFVGRLFTELDKLDPVLQNGRGRRTHVVEVVHDPPVALLFGSRVEQIRREPLLL